ncbi:MAG: hypothetical protein R3Y56_07465 [Akkermansia sp.]
MKLHLPQSLRSALLACLALVSPIAATLSTGTLVAGAITYSMLAPQAQAVDYDDEHTLTVTDNATVASYLNDEQYSDGYKVIMNMSGDWIAGGAWSTDVDEIQVDSWVVNNGSVAELTFNSLITGTGDISYGYNGPNRYVFTGDMSGWSGNMSDTGVGTTGKVVLSVTVSDASGDAARTAASGKGSITISGALVYSFHTDTTIANTSIQAGAVSFANANESPTENITYNLKNSVEATGHNGNGSNGTSKGVSYIYDTDSLITIGNYTTVNLMANAEGAASTLTAETLSLGENAKLSIALNQSAVVSSITLGTDASIVNFGNCSFSAAVTANVLNASFAAESTGTITCLGTIDLDGSLSKSEASIVLGGMSLIFGDDFSLDLGDSIEDGVYIIASAAEISGYDSIDILGLSGLQAGNLTFDDGQLRLTVTSSSVEIDWETGDATWSATSLGTKPFSSEGAIVTFGVLDDTSNDATSTITLSDNISAYNLTVQGADNWTFTSGNSSTLTVTNTLALQGTGTTNVNVAVSAKDVIISAGTTTWLGLDVDSLTVKDSINTFTQAVTVTGELNLVSVGYGADNDFEGAVVAGSIIAQYGFSDFISTVNVGSMELKDGIITFHGDVVATSAIAVSGGTVTFQGDITGTLTQSGGSIVFDESVDLTSFNQSESAGAMDIELNDDVLVNVKGGASSSTSGQANRYQNSTNVEIVVGTGAVYSDHVKWWTKGGTFTISGGGKVQLTSLLLDCTSSHTKLTVGANTTLEILSSGASTSSGFGLSGVGAGYSTTDIYGTLIANGALWSSSTGTLENETASIINVKEGGTLQLNDGICLSGSSSTAYINVADGAFISVGNQGDTIDYAAYLKVTMADGSTIKDNAEEEVNLVVVNTGLSFVDSATVNFSTTASDKTLKIASNLTGTSISTNIQGKGTVIFSAGASVAGLSVEDDATLEITSTVTASSSLSVAEKGTLKISSGGTLNLGASATSTGAVTLNGGTLSLAATSLNTDLVIGAASSHITAGELELNGSITYKSTDTALNLAGVTGTISLGEDFSLDLVGFDRNNSYQIFTGLSSNALLASLESITTIDGTSVIWTYDNGTITLSKDTEGVLYFDATDDAWEDVDGVEGDWATTSRLVVETGADDDITIDTSDVSKVTVKSLTLQGEGDVTLEAAISASEIALEGGTLSLSGDAASLAGDITLSGTVDGVALNLDGMSISAVSGTAVDATIVMGENGSITSNSLSNVTIRNATLAIKDGQISFSDVDYDGTVLLAGSGSSLTIAAGETSLSGLYLSGGAAGQVSLSVNTGATLTVTSDFALGKYPVNGATATDSHIVSVSGTLVSNSYLTTNNSQADITVNNGGTLQLDKGLMGIHYNTDDNVIHGYAPIDIVVAGGANLMVGNQVDFYDGDTLIYAAGYDYSTSIASATPSAGSFSSLTLTMQDGSTLKDNNVDTTTTVYQTISFDAGASVNLSSSAADKTLVMDKAITGTDISLNIDNNVTLSQGADLKTLNTKAGANLVINATNTGSDEAPSYTGTVVVDALTGETGSKITINANAGLTYTTGSSYDGALNLNGGSLTAASGTMGLNIVVAGAGSTLAGAGDSLILDGSISYADGNIISLGIAAGTTVSLGKNFAIDLTGITLEENTVYDVFTGLGKDISTLADFSVLLDDPNAYKMMWSYAEDGSLSFTVQSWGEGTWDSESGYIFGTDIANTSIAVDTTDITNAMLNVRDDQGTMSVGGLEISGSEDLTITSVDNASLSSGAITIDTTAVTANANLVADSLTITNGGSYSIGDGYNLSQTGISLDSTSSLKAGNLSLTDGSLIAGDKTVLAQNSFTSATIEGASLTAAGNATLTDSTLDSASSLSVEAGTLSLAGTSSVAGTTSIDSGASLDAWGVSIKSLDASNAASLNGSLALAEDVVTLTSASLSNATLTATQAMTWNNVTIAGASAVGGTINVGGTLQLDGSLDASGATLALTTGAQLGFASTVLDKTATTAIMSVNALTSVDSSLNIAIDATNLAKLDLAAGDSYLLLNSDTALGMEFTLNGYDSMTIKGLVVSLACDDENKTLSLNVKTTAGNVWEGDTTGYKWSESNNWTPDSSEPNNYFFTGLGDSNLVDVDTAVSASLLMVNITGDDTPVDSYTFSSSTGDTLTTEALSVTSGGATVAMNVVVNKAASVESEGSLIVTNGGKLTAGSLSIHGKDDAGSAGSFANAGTTIIEGAMLAAEGSSVTNSGQLSIGHGSDIASITMEEGSELTVLEGTADQWTTVQIDSLTGVGTLFAKAYTKINIDLWESTVVIDLDNKETSKVTIAGISGTGTDGGSLNVTTGDVTLADATNLNKLTIGDQAKVTVDANTTLTSLDSTGSLEVNGDLTVKGDVASGGSVIANHLIVDTATFEDVSTDALTLNTMVNNNQASGIATVSSVVTAPLGSTVSYVFRADSLQTVTVDEKILLNLTSLSKDTAADNYYLIEHTGSGYGYNWFDFELSADNKAAIADLVSKAGMDVIKGTTEKGDLVLIIDEASDRTWSMSSNAASTPGLEGDKTNEITPIYEENQAAGVKNLISYDILDTVGRVVIDENATIDLSKVVDQSSADKNVTINNLSGAGSSDVLTLIGDETAGASFTLCNNSTTAVLGTVNAQDTTLIVESATKDTVLDTGETITSTGSLSMSTLNLENTDLSVADGANFSVTQMTADADSTIAGKLTLTGGESTLEGSYNKATINMVDVAALTVDASKASGLSLTGSADSITLNKASGATINAINVSGAQVDLGTMSDTLNLSNASSIVGGTLSMVIDGDILGDTFTPMIDVSAANGKLSLTDTTVEIGIDGVAKIAGLTSTDGNYILCALGSDIVMGEGSSIVLADNLYKYFSSASLVNGNLVATRNDTYYNDMGLTENGKAGLKLISEMLSTRDLDALIASESQTITVIANATANATTANSDLTDILTDMDSYKAKGATRAADTLAAAVAGATTTSLGSAMMADVERQLRSTRNRTRSMGVDPTVVNPDMPYYNAWIAAEGSSSQLDADSTYAGHNLSNTGGAIGMDVDLNDAWSVGASFTALIGDLDSDGADTAKGDFDTMYVSAYARMNKGRWNHSFVASYGMLDATLDRTVRGTETAYSTKGDTSGSAFALMYEVGYTYAVTEDASTCVQPVFNISMINSNVDGYTETGSDATLKVGDQKNTYVTFGAGAVLETIVGEDIYNRASVFSGRLMFKADAGERTSEADVSLTNSSGFTQTVKGAEVGAVGIEIGAGLTIPVTEDVGAIFVDASCELRSGMTNFNGTVGYRFSF